MRPIRKKNTVRSYQATIDHFCREFGDADIDQISPDDVLSFLNQLTQNCKPYTKQVRYAHLSAFFNFFRNNIHHHVRNPCDTPMIRKIYRKRVSIRWEKIEKETVDEIIFRTAKLRNRLMLELMARSGMRIGEVLKLTFVDIHDRKLRLRGPKSGKDFEIVYIPRKVADRLRDYANQNYEHPHDRIFPITYEAARMMVAKAGKMVGIHLRPHDLRRHAATYARLVPAYRSKL